MITPTLDQLPVYVREGSILPIAPLTQSTDEKPNGPLTLRVFPGDHCAGDIYQDDGKSYDFRKGAYLRLHFTCATAADGSLTVDIPSREGTWKPWWTSYRIEIVGPAPSQATLAGQPVEKTALGHAVIVPDTGKAQHLTFR